MLTTMSLLSLNTITTCHTPAHDPLRTNAHSPETPSRTLCSGLRYGLRELLFFVYETPLFVRSKDYMMEHVPFIKSHLALNTITTCHTVEVLSLSRDSTPCKMAGVTLHSCVRFREI